MFKISIIIHLLAACIWTGGHIVLVFAYLIPALKKKNLEEMLIFEEKYEKVGMPALLLLVVTGLYQSYVYVPNLGEWFDFSNSISAHFSAKILMLLGILAMALDVKFRLFKMSKIPIYSFAGHVLIVTILSILLVITGLSIRLSIF